jgi:hypothetical protein
MDVREPPGQNRYIYTLPEGKYRIPKRSLVAMSDRQGVFDWLRIVLLVKHNPLPNGVEVECVWPAPSVN